jgi:hypothetical protein
VRDFIKLIAYIVSFTVNTLDCSLNPPGNCCNFSDLGGVTLNGGEFFLYRIEFANDRAKTLSANRSDPIPEQGKPPYALT